MKVTTRVNVNGKPMEATGETVSYEYIVELAGMTGYPTVTYSGPRKGDMRRSGEMHMGCPPVVLEPGMIFNVCHTGNA